VGLHPETQTPIVANFGRFGPFILHDGTYANLESAEDVFTIGLNRAVDMLAEKRAKGPSNRRQPGALRDLGAHPDGGGNVQVFSGRYGAYVKHGKVNATIPKELTAEAITLEEALPLIAERAAKSGGGKPAKAKKAAAKKTPAKKAAAKKTAKKAPAKKTVKAKRAAKTAQTA
jgi:DNA topoisomerase I